MYLLAPGCALIALLLAAGVTLAQQPPAAAIAAVHLARARETRSFTERSLQYLAGAADCPRSVFVSYARSLATPDLADQWYVVSQIWADLALARPTEPLERCWALRGFTFLDRLWDRDDPLGGFFAGSDLQGENVARPDKFVDDNSLAGLVWMEAAQSAADPLERELLLGRARATAEYLMFSDQWDDTFGGGFWWNSRHGDGLEGKPAQTNGLAAAFFLRLYGLTGEPAYRAWAERTLSWLDARLFDGETQLYRWSVHYADLDERAGEVVAQRYFNYDQAILIEANLLASQLLNKPAYAERAGSLGRRVDAVFWDAEHGGYNLEAGIPQVFTSYSAWMTPSLLLLYRHDGDPYWLERAAANVDALNATVWDRANGGYYRRHYVCRDPSPPGCENGASWAYDPEKDNVSQAWMQRAQALLAKALLDESIAPRARPASK